MFIGRMTFLGVAAVIALWTAGSPADASERNLLNALSSGAASTRSKVALPDGNEAAPAPGWEKDPAHFLYQLNKAEEQAITDRAYPLLLAKWPFNTLAVCWENPVPANATERRWVEDAVLRTWQAQSALRFLGWGKCQPNNLGIRILVDDSGPHVKKLGKFVTGIPNGMVLNFTFNNWSQPCQADAAMRRSCIESIAVHEFGHAIGFAHEQNRPDTPGECTQPAQGTSGDNTTITPWDPNSVMNYCNSVYNNDGQLSPFDVKAVQYIYGPPK